MRTIIFGIIFVFGFSIGLFSRHSIVYSQLDQLAKTSQSYTTPVSQNSGANFAPKGGGGSCGG